MSTGLRAIRIAIVSLFALIAVARAEPEAARAESARASERCEATVVETLRKLRGKRAQAVQFVASRRAVTTTDELEIGVKGAGQYRGDAGPGTRFSFSCSFNSRTGLASGVVLREAGVESAPREAAWQPDLSRVSPDACESAAAQLLKEKHPRVANIAMEPDTRRLQPGPDERIVLVGQGAVQRAPGMNAVPFTYRCEFEGRSGRLVAVQTSV